MRYYITVFVLAFYSAVVVYESIFLGKFKKVFRDNNNKHYKCMYKAYRSDLSTLCKHATLHVMFLMCWTCWALSIWFPNVPFVGRTFLACTPLTMFGFVYTIYKIIPNAYESCLYESEVRAKMKINVESRMISIIILILGIIFFFLALTILSGIDSTTATAHHLASNKADLPSLFRSFEIIYDVPAFSYPFTKSIFYTNDWFLILFTVFIIFAANVAILYKGYVHYKFCKKSDSKKEKATSLKIFIMPAFVCVCTIIYCACSLAVQVEIRKAMPYCYLSVESLAATIYKVSPIMRAGYIDLMLVSLLSVLYSFTTIISMKRVTKLLKEIQAARTEDFEFKVLNYYTLLSNIVYKPETLEKRSSTHKKMHDFLTSIKESKGISSEDFMFSTAHLMVHDGVEASKIFGIQKSILFE